MEKMYMDRSKKGVQKKFYDLKKMKKKFLPGIEPGTLRVWGARDNHYTTETSLKVDVL